jgi:hypothetical protein
VLSVLLRYTDSDCPFGIFKLFLQPFPHSWLSPKITCHRPRTFNMSNNCSSNLLSLWRTWVDAKVISDVLVAQSLGSLYCFVNHCLSICLFVYLVFSNFIFLSSYRSVLYFYFTNHLSSFNFLLNKPSFYFLIIFYVQSIFKWTFRRMTLKPYT